jgi:hypothetical protein
MKKVIAVIAIALVPVMSMGAGSPPSSGARNITPVPPEKMAEWTARTGGMIEQIPNGKSVLVVDARNDKTLELAPLVKMVQVMLHLPFELKSVESRAVSDTYAAAAAFKDEKHPAVMLVFDTEGTPPLSIYPENAVGCLNVHELAKGDAMAVKQRLLREFWRLTGFTLGGYAQGGMGGVMLPVFSVADLDEVRGSSLNPLQFNGILNAAIKLDLRSDKPVPYSAACKMGWAPPPTNDVQRAIYERFSDPSSRFRRDFRPKKKTP